jgi:protein-tyrosine kinase
MVKQNTYYEETAEATEFRRLCYKLQNQPGVSYKSYMITSANIGEGKSTTATYLALTSAQYVSGKTLLIDCDLRRPSIHQIFRLSLESGVADILDRIKNYEAVLKNTAMANLKIITAGVPKKSPAELFQIQAIRDMILYYRNHFSLIIIDAPPVIPVSDSILIGSQVEKILFVVKAGKTKKNVAKRALDLLDNNRKKIEGVIINNPLGVMPYYYEHKYYKYKYASS